MYYGLHTFSSQSACQAALPTIQPLAITTTSLQGGTVGASYSTTLNGTGEKALLTGQFQAFRAV